MSQLKSQVMNVQALQTLFTGLIMSRITYTVSQKNCATFIFNVTLANVGRFLKFFHCRNQKKMSHNKNEKFPTVP